LPNIIRMIRSRRKRLVGHVAYMGKKMNAYRVLVGKPKGKKPLVRPRHRWEDTTKMDGDCGLYSSSSGQRPVNTVLNPHIPYNGGNFLSG
jgi:hypothetical protein